MKINQLNNHSILISTRPRLNVQTGDLVTIWVIKRLTNTKWAIGFRGRVYPAKSELELKPDQVLQARVVKTGRYVQFKLTQAGSDPAVINFLKSQGLPLDQLTRQIVAALLKSEMALLPLGLQQIRNKISKTDKRGRLLIRLLVNLLDKGIDISSPGLDRLLDILDYGGQQQHKKDQSGKQKKALTPEETAEEFKKIMAGEKTGGENPLQVFNHLPGKTGTWVIIPYSFASGTGHFSGTFRVFLDNYTRKIQNAVLIVHSAKHEKWSFFIQPQKKDIHIVAFCNKKIYNEKNSRSFKTLASNLQNIGVKIDDIIYDDEYFDGFYPVFSGNLYKTVNTVI